jgi:hypothetical protein
MLWPSHLTLRPHSPTCLSDVAFTVTFGIEALLKVLAFTFRGYISNITNKVRQPTGEEAIDLLDGCMQGGVGTSSFEALASRPAGGPKTIHTHARLRAIVLAPLHIDGLGPAPTHSLPGGPAHCGDQCAAAGVGLCGRPGGVQGGGAAMGLFSLLLQDGTVELSGG